MKQADPGHNAPGEAVARSALGTFLWTLALGTFWMVLELARIYAAQSLADPWTDLRRFLRYLPWQLAIFACIGLPLSILVRFTGIRPNLVSWLRFGAAAFAFLAPSAAIGAFRASRNVVEASAAAAGIGVAIALALGALAALGTILPRSVRAAWPVACVFGGSFAIVPLLSRATVPLRHGSVRLAEIPGLIGPWEWILAAIAGGAAFALAAWGRSFTRMTAKSLAVFLAISGSTAAAADPPSDRTESRRPDVLVVLVDALRADLPGATREGRSLTPNLDAIMAESIVFERAYSAANRTARAMPAIMTSLSAPVAGLRHATGAKPLAEHLRDAGYSTFGISANPYVSAFYGYARGFEVFHDPTVAPDYLVMNPLKIVGRMFSKTAYRWGLVSAELYYPTVAEVRSRATRVLERERQPLFLYLHTMDLHGPYLPPKRFLPDEYRTSAFSSYFELTDRAGRETFRTEDQQHKLRNARQRYEGELGFTDDELGRLVRDLRRNGRWDEMLVWILSDHGEAFGEHDWAGHAGFNVFSTLLHVPMILKPPRSSGVEPGAVEDPVSTYDLLPTTLSILGLEPALEAFGVALVDPETKTVATPTRSIISDVHYPEGRLFSCIEGRWKLDALVSEEGAEPVSLALFDLERDPAERHDLLARRPGIAGKLRAAISRRLERESRLAPSSDEVKPVDPGIEERLRSLGYLE